MIKPGMVSVLSGVVLTCKKPRKDRGMWPYKHALCTWRWVVSECQTKSPTPSCLWRRDRNGVQVVINKFFICGYLLVELSILSLFTNRNLNPPCLRLEVQQRRQRFEKEPISCSHCQTFPCDVQNYMHGLYTLPCWTRRSETYLLE